jgi:hypothetical protein
MGLIPKFDDNGIMIDQYDDDAMRYSNCLFLEEVFGGTYVSVKDKYDIDNYCIETGEYWEGERGSTWEGDRFDPENFHYDRFDVGHESTNFSERKFGLWGHIAENIREESLMKIKKHKGRIIHFIRGNKNRLQICIIRDQTIRDSSKWTLAKPDYCVGNWDRPEHWGCVPRRYTEVYNMQPHGKYELWTPTSGFYMTKEQEEYYIEQKRLEILKAYRAQL